jgi:hypothetical protein
MRSYVAERVGPRLPAAEGITGQDQKGSEAPPTCFVDVILIANKMAKIGALRNGPEAVQQ